MTYRTLIPAALAILLSAVVVNAREITFTTELKNYGGDGAYVALYLTNEAGQYQQTLWIAGEKSKYYKHLSGWARGSGQRSSEYDGLTGASVAAGKTMTVTLDLADSLIDSGHQIRVDTAVEDMRDNRYDVVVPLTTEGVGQTTAGRGYVQSFSYSF